MIKLIFWGGGSKGIEIYGGGILLFLLLLLLLTLSFLNDFFVWYEVL